MKYVNRAVFVLTLLIIGFLLLEQVKPDWSDWLNESSSVNPAAVEVISVADGDTIRIRQFGKEETVRLLGIDTPEKNHPEKPVQCFALEAERFLKERLEGRDVRLEMDPLNTNRDRYDRLLRYVYADGELVNLSIVEQGYGFAFTSFPLTFREDFIAAEVQARQSGVGLWSGCKVEDDNGRLQTEGVE